MPGPVAHTAVSATIGGAVWAATGQPLAMPVAFATGVLVDVDHVLEYYLWYVRKDRRRALLVFHGWEYSLTALGVVLAVAFSPLALAAVLGHLGHLALDTAFNPVHRLMYWVWFRVWRRFRFEGLVFDRPRSLSETLHRYIPLWGHAEPVFLRWRWYREAAGD